MRLNQHPFPVDAYLKRSLVLGFAYPKAQLAGLIPPCLSLDLYEDTWAFVAVAMVETENLRPQGFPKFMGKNFFLIGYRIMVRYRGEDGRSLRGLYILGSGTNRRSMILLGRVFTQYRYHHLDVAWERDGHRDKVTASGGFHIEVDTTQESPNLPVDSPFQEWRAARRFAGPMPFTFSYEEKKKEVLIIEGARETWTPQPVEVIDWKIPFLSRDGLHEPTLANAFVVDEVPYHWKRGRIETWQG